MTLHISQQEIISRLQNTNISAKMRKNVTVLASLITEFNHHFQASAATEKGINLFSSLFSHNDEMLWEDAVAAY